LEDGMADHAEVEYATAEGNDYVEHEETYRRFLHITFVLVFHVVNTLIGLAIGGVMGHWLTALAVFVIATAAAAHGLLSGSKTSTALALVFSLIAFGLSVTG
jgi:Bacterial aa3 type cytochrome c oxidase subunit IV